MSNNVEEMEDPRLRVRAYIMRKQRVRIAELEAEVAELRAILAEGQAHQWSTAIQYGSSKRTRRELDWVTKANALLAGIGKRSTK